MIATKESIKFLRLHEYDLFERNKDLLNLINKRETNACEKVDVILRKYEKYQDVLKTINKKHYDEMKREKEEYDLLKAQLDKELPSKN